MMLRTIFVIGMDLTYTYSNDYSPFHQFHFDLKILHNYTLLIKGFVSQFLKTQNSK